MNSIIYFVEFENRVISATYRNLMIGAKVVIVDKTSGAQLPDPVTTGAYYLKALNGHGEQAAQSVAFQVS
jgi:hypothetical protein